MKTNDSGSLEAQVGELTARVWRLEEALRRQGIALTEGAAPPEERLAGIDSKPMPLPVVADPAWQAPVPLPDVEPQPLFSAMAASGVEDGASLENRIGSQWFNRIGIVAVLIAMAWFLKLAIDNHWIGPLGRVLIGLLAGAGFIAWSEHFRAKGVAAFSYSLKAVGSGTLYLSLWAAFALYQLLPSGVAFAAMIAVTAFNGVAAWAQDAELLAAYAIAGGLSTPLLLSTGENHEIALFSYLLLLDAAVLVLVALKPWSRLLFGAFVGTTAFYIGWAFSFNAAESLGVSAGFLSCFFLLFAMAPRLVQAQIKEEGRAVLWNPLALVIMPMLNAAFGYLAFLVVFRDAGYRGAGPWLAVAFAAFYLLLLNLPARGQWKESPSTLSALHLAAAVTFLTIAIPMKAHGHWITIGWLTEGTALFWVERRVHSKLLHWLALGCLLLGIISLLLTNPYGAYTPVFNARFACYLAAIAAAALVARLAMETAGADEQSSATDGKTLAAVAVLAINLLILLGVSFEIDNFWWQHRWAGHDELLRSYEMYAQFTYSAFFMLFGAALLALGFWRRTAFLRWQALVLLAATVGKVFLWDMGALSQGYRILSFLGLGALLLGVSFVYQRDWLHLRTQQHEDSSRTVSQ